MFKHIISLTLASQAIASHLDDVNGVLSNFKFDTVKFKTQTNCSLDKYPGVSFQLIATNMFLICPHYFRLEKE